MIGKQFASYEISLKLKELGFVEPCMGLYYIGNKKFSKTNYSNSNIVKSNDYIIDTPLWQQCVDFLREKYSIIISNKYIGTISKYEIYVYNMFGQIESFENYECSNFYDAREQAILKAIELINEKK